MTSASLPHPVWLWIDPTRRCNLKCQLCYTRDGQGEEDLAPETLMRMLANCNQDDGVKIKQLTLNWRGEPLLNRRFIDLLNVLQSDHPGCPVEFHTNGTALTPRYAGRLVEAAKGMSICVSIDGGSEVAHDAQRGRGTYRRTLKGLRNLISARGSSKDPKIIIHQLDLNLPLDQYDPSLIEVGALVDQWQRKSPIVPGGERRIYSKLSAGEDGVALLERWPSLVGRWHQPQGPCFWAGNALCVAPNGDVFICLLSSTSEGVIGNLTRESPSSIIAKGIAWRQLMSSSGRSTISHCSACRMEEGSPSASWASDNLVAA